MDTLTGMRLFNKVAETGSFSAAGRAIGLAPSSVSRQISALEDQLGTRLFNRTTRKLHLTEAGEIYRGHTETDHLRHRRGQCGRHRVAG